MFPLVRFLLQICEKYSEIIFPVAALRWKKRTCKQLGECKLQNMASGKVGTAFIHNSVILKWTERQKVEINKNKTNNTQLQKQRQTTK